MGIYIWVCLTWMFESERRYRLKVQNYYYITILYSSKTHVTSSLLFDQFISNIQEIMDSE